MDEEEKKAEKEKKRQMGGAKRKKTRCRFLPMFAEALDNLVTSAIALALGVMMHFQVLTAWIYLVDNISNMVISLVMCILAFHGMWHISKKYRHGSNSPLLVQD